MKRNEKEEVSSVGVYYDADDLGSLVGLPGTGIVGLILGDQLHPPMVNDPYIWMEGWRWRDGALMCTRRLAEMLAVHEDHVLDVGAGVGGPAIILAREYGCQVTGINVSKKQLDFATKRVKNQKLSHKINFVEGDAQDIPFEEACFDVVWCYNMFYHIPDKSRALGEFRRVLKGNGKIAFDDWLLSEKIRQDEIQELQYHWNPVPIAPRWISGEEMRTELETKGLEINQWEDHTHVANLMKQHFEKVFERDWRPPIKKLADKSRYVGMGDRMADDFKAAVNCTIRLYLEDKLRYVQFVANVND